MSTDSAGNQTVEVVKVEFEGRQLIYEATSPAVVWRARTLYEKEPDTVHWIRQFQTGEVFYDIGANVGMYTVLAAAGRGARVFAFEPESQNYALLNRNIVYNKITDRCVAYPLALSDRYKVDKLYLSQFGLGGSCHTFGESRDYHLREREEGFTQGSISLPLDDLLSEGVLPPPHHIKIDVDGLEHLVLQGARETLRQPQLKSLLVELNTHLDEHLALIDEMTHLGFEIDPNQVNVAVRQQGAISAPR